ncbi:transposable element Tcb2 transposase [Trichonephila clavipes]|nr:transposable element Tcb2 transposase [Trichonephila clavipes]
MLAPPRRVVKPPIGGAPHSLRNTALKSSWKPPPATFYRDPRNSLRQREEQPGHGQEPPSSLHLPPITSNAAQLLFVIGPCSKEKEGSLFNWCKEHQNWTEHQWSHVLFTDESRFSLTGDSKRVYIWRESGDPSNIVERDRFGSGGWHSVPSIWLPLGSHCEAIAVLTCPKPIPKVNLVPRPKNNTAFVGFTRVNNQGECNTSKEMLKSVRVE